MNHPTDFENLFSKQNFSVRSRQNYNYVHFGTGESIAVLPYRINQGVYEFLVRIEKRPCHGDDFEMGAITGRYDNGDIYNHAGCAANEIAEEAGYAVPEDQLIPLGTIWGSKITDTIYYLFTTNLSGPVKSCEAIDVVNGKGFAKWVSMDEIIKTNDPILHSVFLKTWATLPSKEKNFV